jgi:hypothetical protein
MVISAIADFKLYYGTVMKERCSGVGRNIGNSYENKANIP